MVVYYLAHASSCVEQDEAATLHWLQSKKDVVDQGDRQRYQHAKNYPAKFKNDHIVKSTLQLLQTRPSNTCTSLYLYVCVADDLLHSAQDGRVDVVFFREHEGHDPLR